MKLISPDFFKHIKTLKRLTLKHRPYVGHAELISSCPFFDSRYHENAVEFWLGTFHIVFDLKSFEKNK